MPLAPHRLSIFVRLPKIATESKAFTLTYEVKNIGDSIFPGGAQNMIISWLAVPTMLVGNPLDVGPLKPGAS